MRFRAPANVQLRWAQLILMLATLVPTVLMTALAIVLLAIGSDSVGVLVTGILVLAFCATSITGYILGTIFVQRGASMARIQSDFLSSVSHELRTPLTSIRMFIETLRDDRLTDPEDKHQCLTLLQREVHRLDGLVERLIELSRMETGKHHFERKPVRLDDVVHDALAAFDAGTLASRVAVEVGQDPNLSVIGDRATLGQALVNLLNNAWKYTPADDKRIRLSVRAHGLRHIEISVEDNGIGIPRDEQRHIFDKFERGKLAIEHRTSGVGLGLATVRAIVRAHKGRIEVRSQPGSGAEFRIHLRRHHRRTAEIEARGDTPSAPAAVGPGAFEETWTGAAKRS
ncbi:MAG TPA: HAMP domain-containing sensor histidine kinase [Haliangium sp.]|nr:HAMP domain-containing sensor histidine kinase [Haliangium sp.]